MSLKEIREREQKQAAREQKARERHKCSSCCFGRWTGVNFYCPFIEYVKKKFELK